MLAFELLCRSKARNKSCSQALIVSAGQCGLQSTLLDLVVPKHALLAGVATTMDMLMPMLVPESGSARQTCFGIWTHTT